MLMPIHIALLTELPDSNGCGFYKHFAPNGALETKTPTSSHQRMNSKTYFASNAMSNRRSNVKYSFLNELRLWCFS